MSEICAACAYPLALHEAFRVLEEGTFCGRCWAERLSVQTRRDVRHIEIAPVSIVGPDGVEHEFHFRYHPRAEALVTFELDDEDREVGYAFRVKASAGEAPRLLLARLMEKVREGLAERQLEDGPRGERQLAGMTAKGRIRWDPETEGEVPRLTIDGREISWAEFGRMLMTFEGFSFRLQIVDD